jgi:phosphotransferase system enzyme I (PtsI)
MIDPDVRPKSDGPAFAGVHEMRLLKGKAVSSGYGDGSAYLLGRIQARLPRYPVDRDGVASEQRRFEIALRQAIEALDRLSNRVAEDIGREHAEIFAAHLALLKDRGFAERIRARIERDRVNVEQAVQDTVLELASRLDGADDPYLREREQDIRDLGRWILRQLDPHASAPLGELPANSVVVAQELLPSDLIHADRGKISAIVTERGGEVSHAVILARSLGVPFVTGVASATTEIPSAARVLVDGQTGEVWIDPSELNEAAYARRKGRYDLATYRAAQAEGKKCVTTDGQHVLLLGNIGRPHEVEQVREHKLEGVGLFRTEYLYLGEREPPALRRQMDQYRAAADALAGRPIIIRTFDFGGDKKPLFLEQHLEANPALGLRGLRFALTVVRSLFREQLRAIVRALPDRDIRIQFPMVIGAYDLLQAKQLLQEVCREDGLQRMPMVGAMIETPAAVFTIQDILEHVDFVSIGTNDLTQFLLAADRNTLELVDDYSVLHPAVLRAIKQVVDAAAGRGRLVSVCGEAVADPSTACLLVGLGVRALSMSPNSTGRVRQSLRGANCKRLEELARQALECQDPAEVVRLAGQIVVQDPLLQ